MRHIVLIFILFFSLTSCLRLDDNLFNNDNSIKEYFFDKYTGEVDFILNASYDIPTEKIHMFTLKSDDNGSVETIYAVYLGDTLNIATDTVIMYCHGNREHMDFYWQRAKLLANVGGKNRYGMLMIDYRGFGLSTGKPTESGMYADVDEALNWLKSKGLTNERLIIYGFSLGSAPAVQMSANEFSMKPSKLILEAPFASAEVMVQDGSLLSLPGSYFTNLKIDNAEQIKKVSQPFCWIHGVDDAFLAMKTHGEVIFKNYNGNYSEAHRISGADHGEVPEKYGFVEYSNALEKFIEK